MDWIYSRGCYYLIAIQCFIAIGVDDHELFELYHWLGNGRLAASLGYCMLRSASCSMQRVHGCLLEVDALIRLFYFPQDVPIS